MRVQGLNSIGEEMSSFYVQKDEDTKSFGLDCSVEPSLTMQEFKDECDINVLMDRFAKTGEMPNINAKEPRYLDLSDLGEIGSLASVMHTMEVAQEMFMRLPAKIRLGEFENDPVRFVEYAENMANIDQLREWGLAKPAEPPPAPMRVEVVNSATPPGASAEAPK